MTLKNGMIAAESLAFHYILIYIKIDKNMYYIFK